MRYFNARPPPTFGRTMMLLIVVSARARATRANAVAPTRVPRVQYCDVLLAAAKPGECIDTTDRQCHIASGTKAPLINDKNA